MAQELLSETAMNLHGSVSFTRQPLICLLLQSLYRITPTSSDPCLMTPVDEVNEEQMNEQQTPRGVVVIDDELRRRVKSMNSISAKLIYICKLSDDEIASEFLSMELQNYYSTSNNELVLNSIRLQDNQDCSLMHICARRNHVKCMQLLYDHGAAIDCLDALNATPLFYSVAQNCRDSSAFLLANGANPNAKDIYFKSPIHIALRNGFYPLVELLILFKADVDVSGLNGNTSLHYFTEKGSLKHVQYLIENTDASLSRTNHEDFNVLTLSLKHPPIVEYLCEKLTGDKFYSIVKMCNRLGENAIHLCCKYGHLSSLLLLLSTYFNNSNGSRRLTQSSTNNNEKKETTSQRLSEHQQENVVSLLNSKDKQGRTPLMIAIQCMRYDIIQFLLQCLEVNIQCSDLNGDTALHHAIRMEDELTTDLLLKQCEANILLKNNQGVAPYHLASKLNFQSTLIKQYKKAQQQTLKKKKKMNKRKSKNLKLINRVLIVDELDTKKPSQQPQQNQRSLSNWIDVSKKRIITLLQIPTNTSTTPVNKNAPCTPKSTTTVSYEATDDNSEGSEHEFEAMQDNEPSSARRVKKTPFVLLTDRLNQNRSSCTQ